MADPQATFIDPDRLAALHAQLRALSATVAVAESLTAGLISATLTETAGSSATFRGGLVVYATDLKASLAGVPAELLAERGAVDPDVAAGLADGVRRRLAATIGLGVTGVAGPDPQDGKPVGRVYLGVAGPRGMAVTQFDFGGDRAAIRGVAVAAAIEALQGECDSMMAALRSPSA